MPLSHNILISSRCGVESEYAELIEFAEEVTKPDLQMFVAEANYDSVSQCCEFVFNMDLQEGEDVADQLLAIATKTISQFSWYGVVHHGRSGAGR